MRAETARRAWWPVWTSGRPCGAARAAELDRALADAAAAGRRGGGGGGRGGRTSCSYSVSDSMLWITELNSALHSGHVRATCGGQGGVGEGQ